MLHESTMKFSFLTAFWFSVLVIFKTENNQGILSDTFNCDDCLGVRAAEYFEPVSNSIGLNLIMQSFQ